MKKILFVLLFVFIPLIASAVSIQDLYQDLKTYNATTKTWSMPAKIMSSLQSPVFKTVVLDLSQSVVKGAVAGLAAAGVAYLANEYVDWLMGNGETWHVTDGKIEKIVQGAMMPPANCPPLAWPGSQGRNWVYVGQNQSLAQYIGYNPNIGMNNVQHLNGADYGCDCDFIMDLSTYNQDPPVTITYVYTSTNAPTYTSTHVPVSAQDVADKIEANKDSPGLVIPTGKQIDKMQNIIGAGVGANAGAGTPAKVAHDTIAGAVSNTDVTDLAQQQVLIDNVATTNSDKTSTALTAADVALAVKAGVASALKEQRTASTAISVSETLSGYPTPTEPGKPDDKGSVRPILEAFTAGLALLPILSYLQDLKAVTAGGTGELCIPLPGLLGGAPTVQCTDFGQWQSTFDFMGSTLLLITSILWTMYLFKTGDA